MREYNEAFEAALDKAAFSNGTEGMSWTDAWCDRCLHDKPARDGSGEGCPLVLVALMGRTPSEWIEHDRFSLGDRYHCIEFRDEDSGPGPEPQPVPDPPGMDALIPRDGYTGPLMYTANTLKPARVQ